MIYEFPNIEDPIKQGDIFYPIPVNTMNLDEISLINDESNIEKKEWDELVGMEEFAAIVPIKKSWAIVASQDCDISRSPVISFFIIRPITFTSGNPDEFKNKNPKKWMEYITKKSKDDNGKWFYLPTDEKLGFSERMVAVFQDIIQIRREGLEKRKYLRKGRLNQEADEHFRESIAQFFRRYPYNEWYSLSKDEFVEYDKDKDGGIKPYPWQE